MNTPSELTLQLRNGSLVVFKGYDHGRGGTLRPVITPELIRAVAPNVPEERAEWIARALDGPAWAANIDTPRRVAHFLAQVAHESGGFRYLEEIWGPTPAQRRYEGRKDLGNTHPGDGYRYRGRGWIQLTGRYNYRRYGKLLGLDLEGNPDLAAQGKFAGQLAAVYWREAGCNVPADRDDLRRVTRLINGGYNGYLDRAAYLRRAKKAVGL